MLEQIKIIESLSAITPAEWDKLAGDDPFLSHAFLHALHESGCAAEDSGWLPQFLTVWRDGALAAAMPLYVKSHSYGEYVFDWAWADAYERHGQSYYPKLLSAIPFTPTTGSRLLADNDSDRDLLITNALALAKNHRFSSLHCLFPNESQSRLMAEHGMMLRQGVQFHWENAGYDHFEHFLSTMSHDKRKKIRQERRKVSDAHISFVHLNGHTASESDWAFFTDCYNRTYREHHSTPYLNRDFFQRLAQTMPDNVLLIIALRQDKPIAAALNIHNQHTLYGRYWGTQEFHSGLHFETCYYQALEFCIANGIRRFEGGAQGSHKLARGFLPSVTWSAHWLAHPQFSQAVENFLQRETLGIAQYVNELESSTPFKRST